MTTKRFNNLSILSIHKELTESINLVDIGNEFASKELTESINLVDIGNEFASKDDGRRMNLGKFFDSDLL